MTPASASYEDHATPQTSDLLSARSAPTAGLVPSPTTNRADGNTSLKKRPSAIGLGGDGEVTPTSAKKKGGKKATKASAKGKKVS